jgi:uncharacterized protein with ATP-grasp and redox domains
MPPPPIRTDSNVFANHTMRVRAPKIVRETARANPEFSRDVLARLEALAAGMESDAQIPPLDTAQPDYAEWRAAYLAHDGDTWHDTEWFYAETFYFRHIVEMTGWFKTGYDPYTPKKGEEIASDALWHALDAALNAREPDLPSDEKLWLLLHHDLWGNSIDLSYAAAAAHGTKRNAGDLLVDNASAAVEHLHRASSAEPIALITDNAGTELALDLVLVDALLDGFTSSVRLHVKQHPTFVSDVIRDDVLHFLAELRARKDARQRALGDRLSAAYAEGALEIAPDFFWNCPRFMHQHGDLSALFAGVSLVISKGDANYRRLLGDALWDATTPFADAIAYMPVPVLALRTCKSDPIVGLPPGAAQQLDRDDPEWRSNGKRGVIQFKP